MPVVSAVFCYILQETASIKIDVFCKYLNCLQDIPINGLSSQWWGSGNQMLISTFAKNLKMLIAERGMTRRGFASRMEVDESVVSRWCNQRAEPSFLQLEKIASQLGCTVPELLSDQTSKELGKDQSTVTSRLKIRNKIEADLRREIGQELRKLSEQFSTFKKPRE